MIRGTTPTIEITLNGVDVDDKSIIEVTFKQNDVKLTKLNPTLLGGIIYVELSQEETFLLDQKQILKIQVRVKNGDKVFSSDVATMYIDENLSMEVL